ncbi:MAG: chemotaxis protein CheW [Planctomycetes bacterium]|nr:chemotaxis protein CheW [Planctomycetota bacterium]
MSPRRSKPIDWEEARARIARATAAIEGSLELSPERARAVLDERARAMAQMPAAPPPADRLHVVTFALASERYAVEANHVREIARLTAYEPVPGTPEFVLGITSLRGEITMIVDLRRFFGVPIKGLTDLSRLVVLGTEHAEFGVLADEALGVTDLRRQDLAPPPASVAGIGREYLRGVTREALILLDAAALIGDRRLFVDQGGNQDR